MDVYKVPKGFLCKFKTQGPYKQMDDGKWFCPNYGLLSNAYGAASCFPQRDQSRPGRPKTRLASAETTLMRLEPYFFRFNMSYRFGSIETLCWFFTCPTSIPLVSAGLFLAWGYLIPKLFEENTLPMAFCT